MEQCIKVSLLMTKEGKIYKVQVEDTEQTSPPMICP